MENFEDFLQVVGWCGFEYEAVHLRLPRKEEDGSWWKTTKDGRVNRSPGCRCRGADAESSTYTRGK